MQVKRSTTFSVAVLPLSVALLLAPLSVELRSGHAAETFSPARVAVYFSPSGGATDAVVREVNAATQQILMQAYSFTSAPIAKALLEAHKRGVKPLFDHIPTWQEWLPEYRQLTQIIAELFKRHGFDGVAYKSSLGPGHNIAFFDLDAADLINCFLFEVKSV